MFKIGFGFLCLTPLHLCLYVIYGHPHHRWPEIEKQRDRKGRLPLEILIKHSPEAAKIVMDRSVQPSTSVNVTDSDYSVRYDFHLLDPGPDDPSSVKGRRFFAPAAMVKHGREQLLQHPLTTKLLEEKWSTFGRLHYYLDFFSCILFVGIYSAYIILERVNLSFARPGGTNNFECNWNASDLASTDDDIEPDCTVVGADERTQILRIVLLVLAQLRIVPMLPRYSVNIKSGTCVSLVNSPLWRELLIYATTVYFLSYDNSWSEPSGEEKTNYWMVGIFSIFLSYVNLVLFLRRFDALGIYVTMYVEVTKTMIKVLLAFSVFILGFGIIFFVLFKEQVRPIQV